jgi:hypothetical protein
VAQLSPSLFHDYERRQQDCSGGAKNFEAPEVKEEPYDEEDTDHCLMYDMAGSREGWYSDASCIELPFS